MSKKTDTKTDFEQAASEAPPSILREFWNFLKVSKKWWLLPILIALGLLGALVVLGGTGVAPFIYSLF